MSVTDIHDLLSHSINDEVILQHFSSVWPVIESSLESFSKVTTLPIFVYFKETQIYASSKDDMPNFCRKMLEHEITSEKCVESGLDRAKLKEKDISRNVQICHAGMINGRRDINTEIGTITILFGCIKMDTEKTTAMKRNLINKIDLIDPGLANALTVANEQTPDTKTSQYEVFPFSNLKLLDSICGLVERLLKSTVGFRVLTINMTHELTFALGEVGHGAQLNLELLERAESKLDKEAYKEAHDLNSLLLAESRLGLYLVRNILSHTSEKTYAEVVKPSFKTVDLNRLLIEMVELYKWRAMEKEIEILIDPDVALPSIQGEGMELRRCFHNVLNNAIKYSYHSTEGTRRVIGIRSTVPYDPGFKNERFAIVFENYGLGLSEDELRLALRSGVRGKQATREVPVGAGIGLSEVAKIMKLHRGSIKIGSKQVHINSSGEETYLTEVKLIFPYSTSIR